MLGVVVKTAVGNFSLVISLHNMVKDNSSFKNKLSISFVVQLPTKFNNYQSLIDFNWV